MSPKVGKGAFRAALAIWQCQGSVNFFSTVFTIPIYRTIFTTLYLLYQIYCIATGYNILLFILFPSAICQIETKCGCINCGKKVLQPISLIHSYGLFYKCGIMKWKLEIKSRQQNLSMNNSNIHSNLKSWPNVINHNFLQSGKNIFSVFFLLNFDIPHISSILC